MNQKQNRRALLIVALMLCLPVSQGFGADDIFIEGALEYYRSSVIESKEIQCNYEEAFFTGQTTGLYILMCYIADDQIGVSNGVLYEVVARYIYDHPEARNNHVQDIVLDALKEKWPEWAISVMVGFLGARQ
jgi:hypothetical protein